MLFAAIEMGLQEGKQYIYYVFLLTQGWAWIFFAMILCSLSENKKI